MCVFWYWPVVGTSTTTIIFARGGTGVCLGIVLLLLQMRVAVLVCVFEDIHITLVFARGGLST